MTASLSNGTSSPPVRGFVQLQGVVNLLAYLRKRLTLDYADQPNAPGSDKFSTTGSGERLPAIIPKALRMGGLGRGPIS